MMTGVVRQPKSEYSEDGYIIILKEVFPSKVHISGYGKIHNLFGKEAGREKITQTCPAI